MLLHTTIEWRSNSSTDLGLWGSASAAVTLRKCQSCATESFPRHQPPRAAHWIYIYVARNSKKCKGLRIDEEDCLYAENDFFIQFCIGCPLKEMTRCTDRFWGNPGKSGTDLHLLHWQQLCANILVQVLTEEILLNFSYMVYGWSFISGCFSN